MDIHAPEGPVSTWREFFVHILIVTIGILIALGLEGVRETVHEHHQIRETRELLEQEARGNQSKIVDQRQALTDALHRTDDILANFDQLNHTPGKLSAALDQVEPGFYFFTTVTWESAISTGVLGHMSPAEVKRFAGATIPVRNFSGTEEQTVARFFDTRSFFRSRPTLSGQELAEGRQKLELLRMYLVAMNHLLDEMTADIEAALKGN